MENTVYRHLVLQWRDGKHYSQGPQPYTVFRKYTRVCMFMHESTYRCICVCVCVWIDLCVLLNLCECISSPTERQRLKV